MVLDSLLGTFASWGSGAGTILQLVLGLVVIGLLGWLIIYYFSYNVKVNIYEKRGETVLKLRDTGREKKDRKKNQRPFELLKNKGDWSGPLQRKYLLPVKGFMGRLSYEANFRRDEEGNLEPLLPPATVEGEWKGMGMADREWAMMEAKAGIEAYSKDDGWEKWLQTFAPYIGFLIIGVFLLVILQQIEPLADSFSNAASVMAEAMSQWPVVAG